MINAVCSVVRRCGCHHYYIIRNKTWRKHTTVALLVLTFPTLLASLLVLLSLLHSPCGAVESNNKERVKAWKRHATQINHSTTGI
jgi:hypothetical protein